VSRATRRRSKVSHLVASEIVRDIVEMGLKEGDQLPNESAMLEEFDVGRASLREALRMLESFGLIAIKQGQKGGPVVAAIDPVDLARSLSFYFHMTGATYGDLIEARLIIEPVMARLAAERQDEEQMKQLREVIEREQEAPLDEPVYVARANEFHYMVSGMSGNHVLDLIGRSLRALYQEGTRSGALLPPETRPVARELHKEISEAIIGGDGELAQSLMARHLERLADAQFEQTPNLKDQRVTWLG
jgi:DNA-binding FadR family transcriptional regulator